MAGIGEEKENSSFEKLSYKAAGNQNEVYKESLTQFCFINILQSRCGLKYDTFYFFYT